MLHDNGFADAWPRAGTNRQAIDPSFGPRWTASDDGRRFTRESGAAWCAADIAAGADPDQARAEARRCIAVYLGEEEN